ncbi:hypothetical protein DFH27DRAFT_539328 [Peziza echinospora]|nr:hypothetical protein DFH27DRAFT_539328 [Peziza echinospora]
MALKFRAAQTPKKISTQKRLTKKSVEEPTENTNEQDSAIHARLPSSDTEPKEDSSPVASSGTSSRGERMQSTAESFAAPDSILDSRIMKKSPELPSQIITHVQQRPKRPSKQRSRQGPRFVELGTWEPADENWAAPLVKVEDNSEESSTSRTHTPNHSKTEEFEAPADVPEPSKPIPSINQSTFDANMTGLGPMPLQDIINMEALTVKYEVKPDGVIREAPGDDLLHLRIYGRDGENQIRALMMANAPGTTPCKNCKTPNGQTDPDNTFHPKVVYGSHKPSKIKGRRNAISTSSSSQPPIGQFLHGDLARLAQNYGTEIPAQPTPVQAQSSAMPFSQDVQNLEIPNPKDQLMNGAASNANMNIGLPNSSQQSLPKRPRIAGTKSSRIQPAAKLLSKASKESIFTLETKDSRLRDVTSAESSPRVEFQFNGVDSNVISMSYSTPNTIMTPNLSPFITTTALPSPNEIPQYQNNLRHVLANDVSAIYGNQNYQLPIEIEDTQLTQALQLQPYNQIPENRQNTFQGTTTLNTLPPFVLPQPDFYSLQCSIRRELNERLWDSALAGHSVWYNEPEARMQLGQGIEEENMHMLTPSPTFSTSNDTTEMLQFFSTQTHSMDPSPQYMPLGHFIPRTGDFELNLQTGIWEYQGLVSNVGALVEPIDPASESEVQVSYAEGNLGMDMDMNVDFDFSVLDTLDPPTQ